eukprot:13498012-Ditylum_brightwellii.AAC.1
MRTLACYKSAFFANLVASYLLKKTENLYRDDGLMTENRETTSKDEDNNNKEHMTKDERNVMKVVSKPSFPFLDMQMFWGGEGNLAFGGIQKRRASTKVRGKINTEKQCLNQLKKEFLHG